MMKGHRRLNHRLQEKFLLRAHLAHPTFLPNIVRRVKLSGVVEIDSRDVFDRISEDMCIGVRRLLRGGWFSNFTDHERRPPKREAITLAAVAPAPAALHISSLIRSNTSRESNSTTP